MAKTDSKPKSRLGRGLSSLISVSDLPVEADAETAPTATEAPAARAASPAEPAAAAPAAGPAEIPVDEIRANPYQPRKSFDEDDLAQLGESIKVHGILQPLVVRQTGERYQLIAGERRLRAAQAAD